MLTRLTISNYALISSLDITFPDGLIILTGETGAGKSILIGALSLLLGKRADAAIFKDNQKNCVVEAEFGDGSLIRRVVSPTGRSRSFYNDEPVSLSDLAQISSRIIDIHEQHQHLLLTDPDYRLSVIDHYAGNGELLAQYRTVHSQYEKTLSQLSSLEKEIAQDEKDADYVRFQLERLTEAGLKEGELEDLEEEQQRLANAEEIRSSLSDVLSILDSGEYSMVQQLKEAVFRLSKSEKYISSLKGMSERVESCRIELDDIQRDLSNAAAQIVVSPDRLVEVEDRMSQLYSLLRKYDCTDIAALISLRDELQNRIASSDDKTVRLDDLKKEVVRLETERKKVASMLSDKRCKASAALSEELQQSIRSLEMPDAFFEAKVTGTGQLTATGGDRLDFLFSANGGPLLCDISKVASGGELSRVMLALKGLMARYTALPTMIFDEIDTGVSGRIADKMGNMIGEMGKSMQIFAITHLPQIASKKGAHYIVYKENAEDGTKRTLIRRLDEEERIREVARMLSGSELSDAAIENAKQLLKGNQSIKY